MTSFEQLFLPVDLFILFHEHLWVGHDFLLCRDGHRLFSELWVILQVTYLLCAFGSSSGWDCLHGIIVFWYAIQSFLLYGDVSIFPLLHLGSLSVWVFFTQLLELCPILFIDIEHDQVVHNDLTVVHTTRNKYLIVAEWDCEILSASYRFRGCSIEPLPSPWGAIKHVKIRWTNSDAWIHSLHRCHSWESEDSEFLGFWVKAIHGPAADILGDWVFDIFFLHPLVLLRIYLIHLKWKSTCPYCGTSYHVQLSMATLASKH